MPNPLEILGRSSRRIASVAAVHVIAAAALPAVVAAILAVFLPVAMTMIARRWGYVMAPGAQPIVIGGLVAIAVIIVGVTVVRAIQAYRHAGDFVSAAEKVDDAIGAHQQILTLATLASPSTAKSDELRSPLFPLLLRSGAEFLQSFNPERTFPFELRHPVLRSSFLASAIALALILATLGVIRPPAPLQREAIKLREIAGELERNPGEGGLALAESVRGAADALENPKLSPEEKKQTLEQVMREMAAHSEQKQGGGNQPGNGSGNAGGNGQSKEGKESNQPGQGSNQNSASQGNPPAGTGGGGAGTSGGRDEEGANSGKDKSSVELQNELSKAEAELQAEGSKNPSPNQPGGNDKENKEQAGNNPNQPGAGNGSNPNEPGNVPTQGAQANKEIPQNGGNQQAKDQGSNQGDTHLGEFPIPAKTQRFLKPGEGGDKLNVHDARYVMFRLPSAVPVGASGRTVADDSRLKAATPYTNAPLKETSSDAPPDERQLVPPRYRDLIH